MGGGACDEYATCIDNVIYTVTIDGPGGYTSTSTGQTGTFIVPFSGSYLLIPKT